LPEHFPPVGSLTAANPAEQLAAAVVNWLTDRIKSGGSEPPASLYEELLKQVEPALLEELMRRLQGNRWVAAQWLGLNRATVRKKLAAYGLADAYREKDAGVGDEIEN
jgi:Fis family transcriptional regulator